MSVSLGAPAGKPRHVQTGQPKELSKAITATALARAQGQQHGLKASRSQEPQAGSSYQNPERAAAGRGSLSGVVVFSRGTQSSHDFLGLLSRRGWLLRHAGREGGRGGNAAEGLMEKALHSTGQVEAKQQQTNLMMSPQNRTQKRAPRLSEPRPEPRPY